MYKTVLFDLDGTLLNTLDDLADSVNHALAAHALPQRTADEVRSFVGNGVELLMHRSVPAGTPEGLEASCLAAFRAHYVAHMQDRTAPYPGILPLLEALHRRGVAVGVLSNKFDAAVKELCAGYFPDLVDAAIGESRFVAKKPDPSGAFEAMKELGASPASTVYVGDSDVDVQTALNAGLPCISVTWGFRDEGFLFAHGARTFAHTPAQLLELLLAL